MRLIAAPTGSAEMPWRVGVEVALAKGALTYWRTPGGAGVAPVFSFAGSTNVAEAVPLYPAPTRIEEEGTEVYGYHDKVTFPLRLAPREVDRPMVLTLDLSYAVCERICLPAKAKVSLELPAEATPSQGDDPVALAIAHAEATVPQRLSEHERDAMASITKVPAADPPSWRVVLHDTPARDLFAEAADGWYFETKKAAEPGAFLILRAEAPAAAGDTPVPVTLTLTGPERPVTFAAVLDSATRER